MSFFSTLLRLCFVILPPSAFRHSPLCLQHERCNLLETKTKQSENLMTDLGLLLFGKNFQLSLFFCRTAINP